VWDGGREGGRKEKVVDMLRKTVLREEVGQGLPTQWGK